LRLFGRYNVVAYLAGAVGSLAAAAAGTLQRSGHLAISTAGLFGAFPVVAVVCAAIALYIRDQQDRPVPPSSPRTKPRRQIVRLSSLFALDAFGGGFVTQAFIAYWLHVRFGAAPEQVGLLFFGSGLLQAGSSIAAARIAARVGELKVMVSTHLPSNLLLAAIALAPSLAVAVVLLLARFALSQMDVPARQAFVAGLVPPQDRLGAAVYTNLARYLGRPLGPAVGGVLMRALIGAPFLAAGFVKVVYDVALYAQFRHEKLLD
jgi:predicted MFS family arabinose efflux permease